MAVACGDVGAPTLLSIRPERVILGAEPSQNALDGEVVELIYLGDHIRCRMNVASSEDFIVKVPNSHAPADPAGRRADHGRLGDRGLPRARRGVNDDRACPARGGPRSLIG